MSLKKSKELRILSALLRLALIIILMPALTLTTTYGLQSSRNHENVFTGESEPEVSKPPKPEPPGPPVTTEPPGEPGPSETTDTPGSPEATAVPEKPDPSGRPEPPEEADAAAEAGNIGEPEPPEAPSEPPAAGEDELHIIDPGIPGSGVDISPDYGNLVLPKTGDDMDARPWLIIITICALILRHVLFFRKKTDDKNEK